MMPTEKTAMQQLIDLLKLSSDPAHDMVLKSATELLEVERKQIEEAVNEGLTGTMDAKEYYNKTFKQ